MNTISSTMRDAATMPLGKVDPKTVLDRLRPDGKKITVAAFNSSI